MNPRHTFGSTSGHILKPTKGCLLVLPHRLFSAKFQVEQEVKLKVKPLITCQLHIGSKLRRISELSFPDSFMVSGITFGRTSE